MRISFLVILAAAISLVVFVLTSCASAPPRHEDLKWEILSQPGQPTKACLTEDDLVKLRTRLDWCDGK